MSKRKFARLKDLYAHAEGTALREFGGMVISDYIPCFKPEDVAKTFNGQRVVTTAPAGVIYTAADPNAGGPRYVMHFIVIYVHTTHVIFPYSHMAIVSGFFDSALNFVVSLFPLCTYIYTCM